MLHAVDNAYLMAVLSQFLWKCRYSVDRVELVKGRQKWTQKFRCCLMCPILVALHQVLPDSLFKM